MIDLFYILRGIVYAQSLLWIKLLDFEYEVNNRHIKSMFLVFLGSTYALIKYTGFSFSQYTNNLLSFYVLLLIWSYCILRMKYNFYNSVCLGFILVFINSYYWEFMLHFNAIIFYGLSFNQVIQGMHLIPAYLLYKKLDIVDKRKFKKFLLFGLMISLFNLLSLNLLPSYIYYNGLKYHYRWFVNNLTRFICLNILLIIIIKYVKIKNKG